MGCVKLVIYTLRGGNSKGGKCPPPIKTLVTNSLKEAVADSNSNKIMCIFLCVVQRGLYSQQCQQKMVYVDMCSVQEQ